MPDVTNLPPRHPVDEGWLARGAPIDHTGRQSLPCSPCGDDQAVQDGYRVIFGGHAGLGAPWFVRPFLTRQSTKGKLGRRSNWWVCARCGSMTPADAEARDVAERLGLPEGFLQK